VPGTLFESQNYRQAADFGCIDRLLARRFPSRRPASLHQLREPSSPGRCESAFLCRRRSFRSCGLSSCRPASLH